MGELSSTGGKNGTVRNHDEDYAMVLDKQISKDLEIDMSANETYQSIYGIPGSYAGRCTVA